MRPGNPTWQVSSGNKAKEKAPRPSFDNNYVPTWLFRPFANIVHMYLILCHDYKWSYHAWRLYYSCWITCRYVMYVSYIWLQLTDLSVTGEWLKHSKQLYLSAFKQTYGINCSPATGCSLLQWMWERLSYSRWEGYPRLGDCEGCVSNCGSDCCLERNPRLGVVEGWLPVWVTVELLGEAVQVRRMENERRALR